MLATDWLSTPASLDGSCFFALSLSRRAHFISSHLFVFFHLSFFVAIPLHLRFLLMFSYCSLNYISMLLLEGFSPAAAVDFFSPSLWSSFSNI